MNFVKRLVGIIFVSLNGTHTYQQQQASSCQKQQRHNKSQIKSSPLLIFFRCELDRFSQITNVILWMLQYTTAVDQYDANKEKK